MKRGESSRSNDLDRLSIASAAIPESGLASLGYFSCLPQSCAACSHAYQAGSSLRTKDPVPASPASCNDR